MEAYRLRVFMGSPARWSFPSCVEVRPEREALRVWTGERCGGAACGRARRARVHASATAVQSAVGASPAWPGFACLYYARALMAFSEVVCMNSLVFPPCCRLLVVTRFAQFRTVWSVYNLVEAWRLSSVWQGSSPAKTRASSRSARAH